MYDFSVALPPDFFKYKFSYMLYLYDFTVYYLFNTLIFPFFSQSLRKFLYQKTASPDFSFDAVFSIYEIIYLQVLF